MTREDAIHFANCLKNNYTVNLNDMEAFCDEAIKALEQEQQTFKWCTDCKEYDQEKHCCHRWSKVIRNTVEEMKQEQESILDKIRAEIEPKCDRINSLASVLPYTAHREIQELLCEIIDLCKAEQEE